MHISTRDTSATAYYQSGPVLDVLVEVLGRRDRQALISGMSEMERLKAERFFKGTKVEVNYHDVSKRRYRVIGVTRETADNAMFYNESIGRNQSVAEFFQTTHEVRLVFHGLPCFRVGNPQRNIMIPMELCSLTGGQRYPRKLNDLQTAEMIKFTAQRPQQRAAAISSGVQALEYTAENPYLKEFEISISPSMLEVPARILPAPRIEYGGSDPVIMPRDGGWNLRGKRLLYGRKLNSWAVVCFGSQRDFPLRQIQQFITEFVRHGNETGLPITMSQPPIYHEPPSNITNALMNAMTRGGACRAILLRI
jgi:eukaryotic translation initiation factor 2C